MPELVGETRYQWFAGNRSYNINSRIKAARMMIKKISIIVTVLILKLKKLEMTTDSKSVKNNKNKPKY